MQNRITTNASSNEIMAHVNSLRLQQSNLLKMSASHQSIQNISDDPATVIRGMECQSIKRTIIQNNRNLVRVESLLSTSHGNLKNIYKINERAQELSAMSSSELNQNDLFAYTQEVRGLVDQIANYANSKYMNVFLFGGSKPYQEPFDIKKDANGEIIDIVYVGGANPSPNQYIGPNVKESGIQDYTKNKELEAFAKNLISFRDSLKAQDTSQILSIRSSLLKDEQNINQSISTIGAKMNKIETVRNQNKSQFNSVEHELSSSMDVDFVSIANELKMTETALEIALEMSSRIMKSNDSSLRAFR